MKVLLIVYDNASYISWFPQGLGYIAAILEKNGHKVSIYNQDVHHYPEEHLTQYLNTHDFDLVGLSIIAGYYQYQKLLKISSAIKNSSFKGKYIIGGHMCAAYPEYFLEKTGADCIVLSEGENAILEYIKNPSMRTVSCEQIEDVDSIPFPAYHLFPIEHYRLLRIAHCTSSDFVLPILSGRGCPFKCVFCYRLMPGFRPRSPENILEEIRLLNKDYNINYFCFSDELLMSGVKRTTELCEAFIKSGIGFKWDCNGRLNYAKPELLKLMKRAGCTFINYGIEAYDDKVLKLMDKHLTCEQIETGIVATLKENISPGFNIIWGNLGDSIETLNKGMEFLLKYDDRSQMRTIRPVTPYPGAPLFETAIEMGLCKGVEDFYENKHVNSDLVSVNFTGLSDQDFHAALYRVNTTLMDAYFKDKKIQIDAQARKLYLESNADFRGWRQS